MKKTIYIAGPMRGYPQFNFPAFDCAASKWMLRGWKVLNPAQMDRDIGLDENKPETVDAAFIRKAIARDLDAIAGSADAIAVLPGWEKSKGANLEVGLARFLGLPVMHADTGELIAEAT